MWWYLEFLLPPSEYTNGMCIVQLCTEATEEGDSDIQIIIFQTNADFYLCSPITAPYSKLFLLLCVVQLLLQGAFYAEIIRQDEMHIFNR